MHKCLILKMNKYKYYTEMNRQSWSCDVPIRLVRKMKPSVVSWLSMDSTTGLKLQRSWNRPIQSLCAQASNADRGGTITSTQASIRSPGTVTRKKDFSSFTKSTGIVGRTFLAILQEGIMFLISGRITISKIISIQHSDAAYADWTKFQGRKIPPPKCEK